MEREVIGANELIGMLAYAHIKHSLLLIDTGFGNTIKSNRFSSILLGDRVKLKISCICSLQIKVEQGVKKGR
jgi:hypothetical protein